MRYKLVAKSKSTIWRTDRIGAPDAHDPEGLRVVDLSGLTRKGLTAADAEALFAFERAILGTRRALTRACKRAEGTPLPLPYKVAQVGVPASLAGFYEGEWVA